MVENEIGAVCPLRLEPTAGDKPGALVWRTAEAADAAEIARAIEDWWGGVHLSHFVQPQFLEHFGDSSLLVHDGPRLIAFLVGILSQRHPNEAYVHFMGVHPAYRGRGLGRELYRRFAALAREHGRTVLRAETGSFNGASIAFHTRLGFAMEPGDATVDGIPVHRDTVGLGHDYVMFTMVLSDRRL